MPSFCAVIGCSNRHDRERERSYYRLPKVIKHQGRRTMELSQARRQTWLSSIGRADLKPSSFDNIRVCSDHFINKPADLYDSLNPDWAPSVNMGRDRILHKSRNKRSKQSLTNKQECVAATALLELNCVSPNVEETVKAHTEAGKESQTDTEAGFLRVVDSELQRFQLENAELNKRLERQRLDTAALFKDNDACMEGEPLSALCTPALVVDVDKVKRNAQRMTERCQNLGVQLRPHMKTHKTLECADIMTAGSRRCIVVSTLAEASFYADHGFDDILYAYCLPFDKVERCAALSERLDLFQVLLDHPDALEQLKKRPLKAGRQWHVWLKLDCGNGRAGILHSEPAALTLAQAIAGTEGVELTGVYVHCGNTYSCRGVEQIQAVAQETTNFTLQFMEKLKAVGITCKSSIGSTPSCSQPVKEMAKLSEVHPGNYVFYDVQQSTIGSCCLEDVAVRVLTRVIGHCPHRNQLLIDCGWSGISLDGAGKLPTGYAVIEGHPNLKLASMTQEHGRVESISGPLDCSKYPLGSLLTLIPYHSCAAAMMHPVYHVHSEGRLLGKWIPTRGW